MYIIWHKDALNFSFMHFVTFQKDSYAVKKAISIPGWFQRHPRTVIIINQ